MVTTDPINTSTPMPRQPILWIILISIVLVAIAAIALNFYANSDLKERIFNIVGIAAGSVVGATLIAFGIIYGIGLFVDKKTPDKTTPPPEAAPAPDPYARERDVAIG